MTREVDRLREGLRAVIAMTGNVDVRRVAQRALAAPSDAASTRAGERDTLIDAIRLAATRGSGHGHWDPEGTRGANCWFCREQREGHEELDALLDALRVRLRYADDGEAVEGWAAFSDVVGTGHFMRGDIPPSPNATRATLILRRTPTDSERT